VSAGLPATATALLPLANTGVRTPGGCERCEATQTVHRRGKALLLTTRHEEHCPQHPGREHKGLPALEYAPGTHTRTLWVC
jgi:hypothetical protein